MSIHLRRWGLAFGLLAAFAIPRPVIEAQANPISPATQPATASSGVSRVAPQNRPEAKWAVEEVMHLKITAYASVPAETKSYGSPFVTADGSYVHDGVVATNLLPFGTKVMIPALFGTKVFTVDDRMSSKLMNNMDIWMQTEGKAIFFGVHYANVVVLKAGSPLPIRNAAVLATKAMAADSILQGPSGRQL